MWDLYVEFTRHDLLQMGLDLLQMGLGSYTSDTLDKWTNMKHIPQRSCVICRKTENKSNLLRFVLLSQNRIIFDLKQNLSRRGYYCCDDNSCLTKLNKWKMTRKQDDKKTR
ncbi:MAG: hypothetical protein DRH57_02630 [Candidatus Cloacimonadota bacterium]|nr:MAG: hypothetical protein DRH57_02630 [Candidatus Cloacimonadota bacterium]